MGVLMETDRRVPFDIPFSPLLADYV